MEVVEVVVRRITDDQNRPMLLVARNTRLFPVPVEPAQLAVDVFCRKTAI